MRRGGPEEEACGVWLDAAALKRRKVQTHLIKPRTKMLTLLPKERKPNISFTQRRIPPAGIRQTSIASFITLQPGMKNGGNRRSISSHVESQIDEEPKKNASQLDPLIQGSEGDCLVSPLASSTPADIGEAELSPQSLKISARHNLGTSFGTVLSLPQPDTLVCVEESKASLAFSFTRDLESSCFLDPKVDKKDSSKHREWLLGSRTNYQGIERDIKAPVGKCHQPLNKAKLERKVSAEENRQGSVCLQTYRESWSKENTESVKQSPCPLSVLSRDSEKNDKGSWSQLFTEDSQGQRVIAHSRAPFRDVTNAWKKGLEQFPNSPRAQCQDGPTQLHLQPDLLFTEDSEGNQVIRHQL